MLILPGNPEFDQTLGRNLPPNWGAVAAQNSGCFHFVARAGSGILEPVGEQELEEYLHGGEYDQRLTEIDDDDLEEFEE
ncbi:MAG: hypothetical protein HC781_22780 [Leptolyngbyaceae cyanobacterium CSU_1_4]|nr:hypothetical protein [Leptolyngbyaceae cyanobacterium CSU_1_4]